MDNSRRRHIHVCNHWRPGVVFMPTFIILTTSNGDKVGMEYESCHDVKVVVTGDFTKYGQPVPRPNPTWRIGIAHFQLWGSRYPSCALTVQPLSAFYRYIFPVPWSDKLNESERYIYASLTWITTDSSNGLVSDRRQAFAWTNFDLWSTAPLGTNYNDCLVEIDTFLLKNEWKKGFGNDIQNGGHLASA